MKNTFIFQLFNYHMRFCYYLFLELAGCGHDDFVPMYGTVKGYGTLGDMDTFKMSDCIDKCVQFEKCRSIEWIPSEEKCELNFERIPLENATIGYMFCSRIGSCKILIVYINSMTLL